MEKNKKEIIEELCNMQDNAIIFIIKKFKKQKADAEDIFQDAFIRAMNAIIKGNFEKKKDYSLRAWFFRIIQNVSIDTFRKRKYTFEIIDNITEQRLIPSPEEKIINKEFFEEIKEIILELPEAQQLVLMKRVEKVPFKAIAENENISINTAIGRMRYARLNLQTKLG